MPEVHTSQATKRNAGWLRRTPELSGSAFEEQVSNFSTPLPPPARPSDQKEQGHPVQISSTPLKGVSYYPHVSSAPKSRQQSQNDLRRNYCLYASDSYFPLSTPATAVSHRITDALTLTSTRVRARATKWHTLAKKRAKIDKRPFPHDVFANVRWNSKNNKNSLQNAKKKSNGTPMKATITNQDKELTKMRAYKLAAEEMGVR